ncbi:putative pre-mRNA-splicing factor [Heterostelium album PN500]|uniref:Pre-mRNA-splicing factor SYF2 n=1 Tax=Heterostelium pallidum (strain ATCC 26659 / Pp 5 / PN500) TaxID=670386 RepID=D3BT01_HETP5|nr:putative pre-mRNA-splicing factor [Heterostelium album PN500]EFA75616.1 putative pre-mRNA-splicing factor [Heterostelium album PN500]|eukprot:XP_020427750.1 putative pre-mRNA-splicing factor [Heterostelium album PN500]
MSNNTEHDYETIESLKEEIEIIDRHKDEYREPKSFNAVAFDYTEENERATFSLGRQPKLSKINDANTKELTPQQQKLIDLKKKLVSTANEAKKNIYKSVVDEHSRIHNGPMNESEEKKKLFEEKKRQEEEEIKKEGGDPEREKLKNALASDLENKAKKKGNKKFEGVHNKQSDSHIYNSYKKRVKEMESFRNSEHYKEFVDKDQINNETEYGKHGFVPEANVNAMKQELLKHQMERRNNFKKRGTNPDEDVSWINEQNRVFNKKVSRAYDKYTLEIRQNLERGTSL